MKQEVFTCLDMPSWAEPGALIKLGDGKYKIVTAVTGTTLTVKPYTWWRRIYWRIRRRLQNALKELKR